jgi:tRNA U34 5-methylaminomethyl-2-thiouridine-forming methyltransferase MnmC
MIPGVVITGDGSSTVLHSGTGEHYHSTFGAITESMHVFIRNGLHQVSPATDPLNVLEIGFGTGLNALLTLLENLNLPRSVFYDAIEPFPLEPAVIRQLNYPEILGGPETAERFFHLHEAPPGAREIIAPRFSLMKIASGIEEAPLQERRYHLVYFDAFSPNVQPELWQPLHFSRLYGALREGGLLLTYCSKGTVARMLKEAGFTVDRLPGPPGKRHMLRGMRPFLGSVARNADPLPAERG